MVFMPSGHLGPKGSVAPICGMLPGLPLWQEWPMPALPGGVCLTRAVGSASKRSSPNYAEDQLFTTVWCDSDPTTERPHHDGAPPGPLKVRAFAPSAPPSRRAWIALRKLLWQEGVLTKQNWLWILGCSQPFSIHHVLQVLPIPRIATYSTTPRQNDPAH